MFSQVEPPVRAYERVVQQIEEAIICGDIQPGGRLPSERDLMQQCGVSRATIREALRVLQSTGLVRSRPGHPNGAEVLGFNSAPLKKSLSVLARTDLCGLCDLLQFRMFIESSVSELAARLSEPQHLEAMAASLVAMEAAIATGFGQFSEADLAFHRAVAEAAGNTLFRACNEVVHDVALTLVRDKILEASNRTDQMTESLRRHRLVFEAIEAGDARRAAYLARKHQLEYYAPFLSSQELRRVQAFVVDVGGSLD